MANHEPVFLDPNCNVEPKDPVFFCEHCHKKIDPKKAKSIQVDQNDFTAYPPTPKILGLSQGWIGNDCAKKLGIASWKDFEVNV